MRNNTTMERLLTKWDGVMARRDRILDTENKSNTWRSLSNTSNRHGYGFPCDASYTRIKDITFEL